jgi:RNA polymerase sigma-70 factor (ECF subfamily)
MTRVATRLAGREGEADDVVQDSLVEAVRDLRKLRDPEAFRSWVLRITVNRARKTYRRRRWTQWLGADRAVDDASLPQLAAKELRAEARAELELIERVLRRVPTEQRFAWMLRHVEGETLESVAELTGCSLATAKRRIAGVQRVLQQHIERGAP